MFELSEQILRSVEASKTMKGCHMSFNDSMSVQGYPTIVAIGIALPLYVMRRLSLFAEMTTHLAHSQNSACTPKLMGITNGVIGVFFV
jgi:hypothetical protein